MDNEHLNPQESEQSKASAAKAKEDAWLEEFFRDFSLPEDVDTPAPSPKEQILKDRWETAPIPTAQIPELPNDMIYEEDTDNKGQIVLIRKIEQQDHESEKEGFVI